MSTAQALSPLEKAKLWLGETFDEEPKIYESEIERKWEEKAMIARNRNV